MLVGVEWYRKISEGKESTAAFNTGRLVARSPPSLFKKLNNFEL